MKYDFDECIRRILAEVKNLTKTEVNEKKPIIQPGNETGKADNSSSDSNTNNNNHKPNNDNESSSNKNPSIEHWDENAVEKWLNEKKINPSITKNILPCNGKLLSQMHSMLIEAPEFFYKSISFSSSTKEKSRVSTRDVALFSYELKSLFKI